MGDAVGVEYTPNTGAVRGAYTRAMRNAFIASTGEHEAEFDRWLAAHDREAVHEAAEAIRRHATPPSELANPKSDALLAWVADWIENPPEWVKISYRDRGED